MSLIKTDIVQIFSMGSGAEHDLFRSRKPKSSAVWSLVIAFASYLLSIPIIWRLTQPGGPSDLITHANLAREMVKSGGWISYSIYYPLIYGASLGNHDFRITRIAITILISSLFVMKTIIIFHIVRFFGRTLGFALAITAITSIGMALLDPGAPTDIYLGQFAPNLWHNSTTIMAEPFVLLAFAAFMWFYKDCSLRAAFYFSALITISVLCKPSFAIAFLPVAVIALIFRFFQTKESIWHVKLVLAFLPVVILIVFQYLAIFTNHLVAWHTAFVPFVTWQKFSDNLPLSFALSFGPALLAIACFPNFFKQSHALLIAWCATGIAFLELLLLAEQYSDGTLSFDGNFFWGIYQCLLLVYLLTMKEILAVSTSKSSNLDRKVGLSVAALGFIFHGLSGLYYILFLISLK